MEKVDQNNIEQMEGARVSAEAENANQAQPEAQDVAATAEELARLRQEREALLDRVARMQADFDNFRKRSQREQADFREYALADALKALLPVLDNFDFALKADAAEKDLRAGVELIRRQMEDVLAKLGVQHVGAKGEEFNPHLHEAIEMVDTGEVPDHHIVDELQRGYRYKERLLRPAMVRVARNPQK